jgi:hypothetical protein
MLRLGLLCRSVIRGRILFHDHTVADGPARPGGDPGSAAAGSGVRRADPERQDQCHRDKSYQRLVHIVSSLLPGTSDARNPGAEFNFVFPTIYTIKLFLSSRFFIKKTKKTVRRPFTRTNVRRLPLTRPSLPPDSFSEKAYTF